MTKWNEMSPAAQKIASTAAHFANDLEIHGRTSVSMTEATTAIWGTSGTGNPNAVRLIEACAAAGYLRIRRAGKVKRYVSLGDRPIPAEAMSQEDKDFYRRIHREAIEHEARMVEERIKRAIKETPEQASQVFLSELKGFLGGGRRR